MSLNYETMPLLWRRYETLPRQLAFRAQTRDEWETWHAALVGKLTELLGGFPPERCALDAHVLESGETPDYVWEHVAFQTEPGLFVPCYVLIPRHVQPPYRPVIALHGHGTDGATYLLGRVMDEATREKEEAEIRTLEQDYARQLALHGFMVFVPVQRGFGERLETGPNTTKDAGPWSKSCRALAFNALLLGKTLLGSRVWDVMRTIDYARSRAEPMTPSLGCIGLSGGGTVTLFTTALEPRITAAMVSGYLNAFRASIMSIEHCECNYVPHILEYAEMADIASLIAPRPLLVQGGRADPIFPIQATETAFTYVTRVYDLLGARERLDKDIFQGAHQFKGHMAFDWLARWL